MAGSLEETRKLFATEFGANAANPDRRTCLLAYDRRELIGFGGARHYDRNKDEAIYKTIEQLPTGWYLRGVFVHPNWRRRGLARELTRHRLGWLAGRTDNALVFLSDENKETLSMYFDFGFQEVSRGWIFASSEADRKDQKGILLRKQF